MVGLPARGKTYIAQKASRYLNWLGLPTRVFNVGDYRRRFCGAAQRHAFFDAKNTEAEDARAGAALAALEDMIKWLKETEGQVAIYDATNTTVQRREMILKACQMEGVSVLFIESICHDEELILANIKEVKLSSPDYENVDSDTAVEDFKERIQHYAEVYQTINENGPEGFMSFVKLIDVGAKHGETTHNMAGRIGGDANLSDRGFQFAQSLPSIVRQIHGSAPLTAWTSTLQRTIQTSQFLDCPKLQWKALDELDAGVCDGLTYEEIEERHPEDFHLRDTDKFHFRYRGGESYADLVLRLEPIIMEVERQENIMIIGHQAVLRAILAYFLNKSHDELPYLKIPLHMLIQLTPRAYGCQVTYYRVGIDAVDTYRPKPGGKIPCSPESITIPSPLPRD